MEPSDIDRILKSQLEGANNAHQKELENAKPFVWAEVQKNLGKTRTLNWYHLAAAILFLLISFTFVFVNVQKNHDQEMVLLSNKIDQLQQNYQAQLGEINAKNTEVNLLATELKNVELKLSNLDQERPISQKETIVYRTDTVYLKQVEYITTVSNPVIQNEDEVISEEVEFGKLAKAENLENEIDDAIYPSLASQSKKQKSETIKLKFLRTSRN